MRSYTTFAMRWLIPRLSGFHQAHPDIEVLLTASLDEVDFRDLRHFTLLHSIARPDDWGYWLDANGVAQQVDSAAGMTYQSSAMAYAAAIEGQGLAMAQLFLVEDDLRDGKLVMPFKKTLDMGSYTYYLLTPAGRPESASMKQFRTWMLAQFALQP
nr:LysR substrate-binding domain-containing protein [Variovorax paradoxus]